MYRVPPNPGQADSPVECGIDRWNRDPPGWLDGRRLGMLTSRASRTHCGEWSCEAIARLWPGQLRALFTPQHGFWADAQANMVESSDEHHPRWNVPIYSLYSGVRSPTQEMLQDVDTLIVDLFDVGCRVYTFAWTMRNCLEASERLGLEVVVLDRPNPLGGVVTEGPVLSRECFSFVGMAPIPVRHAWTLGELARYLKETEFPDLSLRVVEVSGWQREQMLPETGNPWRVPSPNLPQFDACLLYPGLVLLEATNVSEGRGTTTPFQLTGAPFVDPWRLCDAMREWNLPGVVFHPARFEPTFDKWKGVSCGGIEWEVTEPHRVRPYRAAVALLATIRRLWGDEFALRDPPYEYEETIMPIDLLSGDGRLRSRLLDARPWSAEDVDRMSGIGDTDWDSRFEASKIYAGRSNCSPDVDHPGPEHPS